MLEKVIDFLNLKLQALNMFQTIFCLAESVTDATGIKSPRAYITKGQWQTVNDVDKSKGLTYWRQTGDININTNQGAVACDEELDITYPLRLIITLPKKAIKRDDAYSEHRVAESLISTLINNSSGLKINVGAKRIGMNVEKYSVNGEEIFSQEFSGLKKKDYDYKICYLSIDVKINIIINKSCLTTNCI